MRAATTILLAVVILTMSEAETKFEYGEVSRGLLPTPFQQLVVNPHVADGDVIRTFGFIAMHGEVALFVGSSDGVKYHDPLSVVYLKIANSLEGEKPELSQMHGMYVMVEGQFAVQFADDGVVGTAVRTLSLTRLQVLDDQWHGGEDRGDQ